MFPNGDASEVYAWSKSCVIFLKCSQWGCSQSVCTVEILCDLSGYVPNRDNPKVYTQLKSSVIFLEMFPNMDVRKV